LNCGGGKKLTTLKRFRLRSIMIGIAALALLMGAVRFGSAVLGIERMLVRVEGSNLAVRLDMASASLLTDRPPARATPPRISRTLTLKVQAGSESVSTSFLTQCYALIPITTALILIAVPFACLAVAVCCRSFRARNRTGRACDRLNADGSGEPEEA
jgi:hypothetical protein